MIAAIVVLRCDGAFYESGQHRLVRCTRMLACEDGVARSRRWALRHGWMQLVPTDRQNPAQPAPQDEQRHLCPSHARRYPAVMFWQTASAALEPAPTSVPLPQGVTS